MLWMEPGCTHRRLEIEAQPLLNSEPAELVTALRKIHEQNQIKNNRCRQNGISAQEVQLDLHRVSQPAKDVDIVPAFFVVAARRVVVDANFVRKVAVEIGIKLRLQDVL